MIDRVFVYGTLNPNHPDFNRYIVERAFGCVPDYYEAVTKGTRLPSRMPWDFVWFHDDGDNIEGVVLVFTGVGWELQVLDAYEGYSEKRRQNNFHRKEITLLDGTKAWGYEWGMTQEETGLLYERRTA